MSQFYASITGRPNKSTATRQGHKTTGIYGHIRGWNIGIEVIGRFDKETGKDVFEVYQTGGSNGTTAKKLLTEVKEN